MECCDIGTPVLEARTPRNAVCAVEQARVKDESAIQQMPNGFGIAPAGLDRTRHDAVGNRVGGAESPLGTRAW